MNKNKRGNEVTISIASNQKNANAGAINKSFDVFDFATAVTEKQAVCNICNPSNKTQDAANLCAECSAKSETLATVIFGHLTQNRKVVRLHRCSGCRRCVTPSKFSRDWGICKLCVADVREKSETARSNFIARTVNNFQKTLRGALAQ